MTDPMLKLIPPGGREEDYAMARAVLGAVLIEPSCFDEVESRLRPEDFYRPAHTTVWLAILALRKKGRPVDVLTLREQLAATGALEGVGGEAALAELTESVPTSSNVAHYAASVERASMARRLIAAAAEAQRFAYDLLPSTKPHEIVAQAERIVHAVESRAVLRGVSLAALTGRVVQRAQRREAPVVWPTGFADLDERLGGGLRPGKLTLLAARPSMGKTALVTRIVRCLGGNDVGVTMFSLETEGEGLTANMLAAETGCSVGRLAAGALSADDQRRFYDAVETFERLPVTIHEGRRWRLGALVSAVRHDVRKLGTQVVAIDYVQLIEPDAEGRSREEEVRGISRELKLLALELGIAVLAAAQLSREVEKRRDKWPMLSDLRESGSLEQDADNVLLLHRPEYYEPKEDNRGLAYVDVAKNRDGPPGVVDLRWVAECMRFESFVRRPAWHGAGSPAPAGSDDE